MINYNDRLKSKFQKKSPIRIEWKLGEDGKFDIYEPHRPKHISFELRTDFAEQHTTLHTYLKAFLTS